MAQTKATKKFEKRHLKDTLAKRNSVKKIKQQKQRAVKKKARKAEHNGGEKAPDSKAPDKALESMTVDDFFQQEFQVPELPAKAQKKRKRQEAVNDAASSSDEGEQSDSQNEGDLQAQIDALAKNQPEFYKHLKEAEPELLKVGKDEQMFSDEEDEDEQPERKKKKPNTGGSEDEQANQVSRAMVGEWRKMMTTAHSLRAARKTVAAFRSAVSATDGEEKFKYTIRDPEAYHQLLTTALECVPLVLQHHAPAQESKSGKVRVQTDSDKFKSLVPLLRSHTTSIVSLLDTLTDTATLRLTLQSILPLLPYLLSFKKLCRDVVRAAAAVWSSPGSVESARIAAFMVLLRLVVIGDAAMRENVLKSAYQALIKGSRNTTVHTIAAVNLMKNSAKDLWGYCIADGVAYTTSFGLIRQLAIHLRGSITNNSNESYKLIYNWQYVHSLDFWSRVLSAHAADPSSPLRPLIYPLVQVTLGALRLIPTAAYFPLRFQLIRSLQQLSVATQTYIPLAPALYEVLSSAEMRKPPQPSTIKPLDFATSIRASKSHLRTRVYQDGVGEQVVELLADFYAQWSKSIAFPELALPLTLQLRRWLKDAGSKEGNCNAKVNGALTVLVQKLEAHSAFIESKRAQVNFAPDNRKEVEQFLVDVKWETTPLGAYVVHMRKAKEERERVVKEAREEERKRDGKEKMMKKKKKKKSEAIKGEESTSDEEQSESGAEASVDGISEASDDEMEDFNSA
ncbi:Noc2-domain-containing protein [Piedraia hortae CBS 480.64]|uniref:Noc2-domain-containing protein n=1 Tax=Piedraia hortae CBS 480.64 TaxID=1314780 RepID=A0A6A7BWB7_9PEZI|nr:Noc2-domain-containing protein [Piedraia hortae CBS 480.64]